MVWSRSPVSMHNLKFVLKENYRNFILGVTKYLKKVSRRQVTWLQIFQKKLTYQEISCFTSYNSLERQTLKELGSKPCFHWLPTTSSPTKLFLFKIFSTCRAIWIKGLTDFETLAEEWWNAYPTYLQESRYVCVYM